MQAIPKQISEYISMGLTQETVKKNRSVYGSNEINTNKKTDFLECYWES